MRLVIEGASKRFGGLLALDDVSFTVESGSLSALIGPNGAGKTTMFNLIAGMYKPTSGTITVDDKNITNASPAKVLHHGIARTFQLVRSFKGLTVLETVMTAGHYRSGQKFIGTIFSTPKVRFSEEILREEAYKTLEALELQHLADQYVHELPYGLQRQIEIAKALMTGAEMLLLDEPAAGLHEEEVIALRDLLLSLRKHGKTILLVEHNMPFVLSIANHIVVLEFGKKIGQGTADEIMNNQRVIDSYLGKQDEDVSH